MKLNKIMKKTVLATMAVLMAAALSFTGCSNGDDNDGNGGDLTQYDLGLSSMGGWGKYEISNQSATGFTMKSTAAQELNDCGGADITFGAAKKVAFKVTNNASEECWVQVIIKKDGSTEPVVSGSRITSAKLDGVDVTGDITWGVNTTIDAGASKNFELVLNGTDADKFVFSLNSNTDNTKTSGDITVSNAYMYK